MPRPHPSSTREPTQDFIAAAKDGEWDTLREILGRHPGYARARSTGGWSDPVTLG